MEGRDVDAGVADRPAERADHAGLVVVGDIEHVGRELRLHMDALDLDDARLVAREQRAGDAARLALGGHGQADHRHIVLGLLALDLANIDAALARDDRRVDHVDRGHEGLQQALQHDRGERPCVHRRGVALIFDRRRLEAGLGELTGEAAELLGELHIGLQARHLFRADGGHVERVGDGAGEQIVAHLLGHLDRDVLLRLRGRGAEMRRADHLIEREERIVLGRLDREDIEGCARDVAAFDRRFQRLLVDQAAARRIDDAHALLRLGQRLGIENVARLVRQRHVERDEIGPCEQRLQRDLLDVQIGRALGRKIGIVGDHLHAQAPPERRHDRADVAATDDTERLAEELNAHEAVLLPLA